MLTCRMIVICSLCIVVCTFVDDIVGTTNKTLNGHIFGQQLAMQIIIDAIEAWKLTRVAIEVDARSGDSINYVPPSSDGNHQQPLILTFTGPTGVGKFFHYIVGCGK